ncbi:hypothetical protein FOZ62_008400, partial [Perkinsus olseni]
MLSKAAYVRPVAAYSALGRTTTVAALTSAQVRHSSTFTNGMGFGVTIPQLSGPGGVFVTKYKITRPYNENTTWDDLLLYMPAEINWPSLPRMSLSSYGILSWSRTKKDVKRLSGSSTNG